MDIIKYPRTQHIYGSRIQKGDEDLEAVRLETIQDNYFIIEEKMDGANSAISFDEHGKLYLQSRGHFLTGGPRERHFSFFKQWANTHKPMLHDLLKSRYTMYGEWLYAKHTIYYDNLPNYFMEFDILDRTTNQWLSTRKRHELLKPLRPIVSSVRVIHECDGKDLSVSGLESMIKESPFISDVHLRRLTNYCIEAGLNSELAISETDSTRLMEGLYIKTETDMVTGRYKWVRKQFLDVVAQSDSHWHSRPIIPNWRVEDGIVSK